MAEWRWIKGYEGLYQVSDGGIVRSVDRFEKCNGGIRKRKGRNLSPVMKSTGYVTVNLYSDGAMRTHLVHRLVADAFIPNELSKREVNHISGDKSDNRASNLEWVTASENIRHSFDALGRVPTGHGRLTGEQVAEIIKSNETQSAIARKFGVSRSLVGLIKQRKIYKEVS